LKLSPEAAPLYKAVAQQYRKLKMLLNRLDKLSKNILRHQAKLATHFGLAWALSLGH
jgi:hypothetical protein